MTAVTRSAAVLTTAWLCLTAAAPSVSPAAGPARTADTAAIFTLAYNLHFDRATTAAESLVAAAPDSSSAHRALATVIWMHLLFDRGGLTVDHYLGGMTKGDISMPPAPTGQATRFRTHIDHAIRLAEDRRKAARRDVDAAFDAGMAHAVLASWQASIEGKVTSAFRSAGRAFDAHEQVLALDAGRHDAGLVVGTYRYSVAVLSFPKRWLAYLAGFGGGKARGIALLTQAAGAPRTSTDAKLALAVIHSRESRHDEALALFRGLMADYPDNRLLRLEAGAAAWRAGHAGQADALLTEGLAVLDRDPRPQAPGERALWLYKRGMARVSLNTLPAAMTDLREALTHDPQGWVRGRIHLEQGKISDLQGQRQQALAAYDRARSLCTTHRDPWCVDQAGRFRKRPFKFTPKDSGLD
jgi:hypothetical protein